MATLRARRPAYNGKGCAMPLNRDERDLSPARQLTEEWQGLLRDAL
jgi:hypothetical protein